MTDTAIPEAQPLSGSALIAAFAAASEHLAEQAHAIDAINVYPVPDGDTGSNMAATMSEAVANASAAAGRSAGAVLDALARGALYGARGNSGVILSQALRGFASAVAGAEVLDAASLAHGLQASADAAYRAVSHPVEGTMLTVLRAAAAGAAAFAGSLPEGGRGHGCTRALEAAITAAEIAEEHTTEQLAPLAEAGVTDSGGEGICVILRGLLAALTGQRPPAAMVPDRPIATLAGHESEELGFCTEFILERRDGELDLEAIRAITEPHRSVVVVGDASAVRVHVHTDDPEGLFREAERLGHLTRAKAENMTAQRGRFEATGSGAGARVALLALSPGPGFDAIFESLGAHPVRLGDIVKPAAGDIAAAANALRVPDVIVLPNHKNVLLAARQAASMARCTLSVVPAASVPQGIAAALAFDPERPLRENLEQMHEALADVITVEVTTAAADRRAEGISVKKGDAIGILNGRLVTRAADPVEALVAALNRAAEDGVGLVTIYAGAAVSAADLERARRAVSAAFRDAAVEALTGGQSLYHFIASLER